MSQFTNGHALLIGVGADLSVTVDDAKGIAKILKDPERCVYPTDQVALLTETAATRQGVLDALDKLACQTNPNATVVFYFSGHGYEVDGGFGKQYFGSLLASVIYKKSIKTAFVEYGKIKI